MKVTIGQTLPMQCPFTKNIFESFTLKCIRTLRNYERAIDEKNNKFRCKFTGRRIADKVESLRDTLFSINFLSKLRIVFEIGI